MIITQLHGGLGNQLFQYAAGRALALKQGRSLYLDMRRFGPKQARQVEITKLRISARLLPNWAARLFDEPRPGQIAKWATRKVVDCCWATRFEDREHGFDPEIRKLRGRSYLRGYWQTEKYFAEIRDVLREEFTSIEPPRKEISQYVERVAQEESLCLHVRRGDYVSHPKYRQTHGALAAGYYTGAAEAILDSVRGAKVYVFSDDPGWAAREFEGAFPLTMVSGEVTQTGVEDFVVMRACRHFVVANSTFSWWAAWLGEAEGSRVVAPQPWLRSVPSFERDLVPARWGRRSAEFDLSSPAVPGVAQ
jgi:hypothetical protein